MSTEIARKESGTAELSVNPTKDWANLNGTVQPQSLIAPIYFQGAIYAFAQDANNSLDMCTISYKGTTGNWLNYNSYRCDASPAVAASGSNSSYLGVACRVSQTIVQVSYIPPTQPQAVNVKQTNITGGLQSNTVFAGPVQIVQNLNGYLEAFALDTIGTIWCARERTTDIPASWTGWTAIGGAKLDSSAKDFKAFQLPGGPNAGCIQVVAVGADGKIYQATENSSRLGSYSDLALLGTYEDLKGSASFAGEGVDATYDPSFNVMVYAAFDKKNTKEDYFVENSSPWQNGATAVSLPVLAATSADAMTYLVWMDNKGQVNLTPRNSGYPTDPYFSSNYLPVGSPNSNFAGNMTKVVDDDKIGLFQVVNDGTVAFINFRPE